MAFHVYPDPQTAPRLIPANTLDPTQTVIPELVGPDNVSEGAVPATNYPTTMFIRFVMLGAVPAAPANYPTVWLQAGGGTETEVATAYPTPTLIPDGGGNPEIADAFKFPADANNVYLVKVLIFTTGQTWKMRLKNNDGAAHKFIWVIADSLANSRQPWIDIPPVPPPMGATTNYNAFTSQSPAPLLTVPINNYGTGQLSITDSVGTVVGNPNFVLSTVPANPIPPNSSTNLANQLQVTFNPSATIGQINTSYSLNTNDSLATTSVGHNRQISLSATTRTLEVGLMLDASGSMAYMPDGNSSVPNPNEARWGRLKSAAKQFLDLLGTMSSGEALVAMGEFPDQTTGAFPAPSPSAANLLVDGSGKAVPVTASAIANGKNAMDAHTPQQNGGATPMGFGVGRAIGTTATSAGYFIDPNNLDALTYNKRFLVLMSDGAENSFPPHATDFTGNSSTSFKGKKIKVLSIGYGNPALTTFEVDWALLQNLASDSVGQFFDSGTDNAGLNLKKQFRAAITAGLTLDPTTDPGGFLTAEQPEVRRQVTIIPYDTRVAFVVNWSTPNSERVSFSLVTPNCEIITPASAKEDQNITYRDELTYALYAFNHDFLCNSKDPAHPRYGSWTLIITGHDLSSDGEGGGSPEPYDYEVITDSRLKLALAPDRPVYYAGDAIKVNASLAVDGLGVPEASVTLQLTAPGQAADNWLAFNQVTPEEFKRAAEQFAHEDVIAVGIKAFALQQKQLFFDPLKQVTTIPMQDPKHQGLYTAVVPNASTPGTYSLYVTAIGQTEEGISFRREKRLDIRVDVRPNPVFTIINVVYGRIALGDRLVYIAKVTVTPKDSFGNVILIDPAFSERVKLTIHGGKFTEKLTGNLDGSYTQTAEVDPNTVPAIGLMVDGHPVISSYPLPSLARLQYVDQVVAYRPGDEAELGANAHRDPKMALGDVTVKNPNEFVSLGGHGVLTVAIAGKEILADDVHKDEGDITIFVHPDDSLRAYEVQVLPVGVKGLHKWVSLGTSSGVTQSFRLSHAKLEAAAAVRILDRSGRVRGIHFKPSSTPGVSIQGVGIHHVGDCQPGLGKDLDRCLCLLKRLLTGECSSPTSPEMNVKA